MTQDINSKHLAFLVDRVQHLEKSMDALSSQVIALSKLTANALDTIRSSQAVYLGDHRALTFLKSGHKIFVDTRSVDIGTHLLMQGLWEPNYVKAFLGLLKPGNVVLDVGANHGVYSLLAAQAIGPTGKVFAFEPNPVFAELIKASVSVNGLDKIVVLTQAGLADREYEIELVVDANWSGGGHLATSHDSLSGAATRYKTRCIPLDQFPDLAGRTIDAIKMDIEGAEGLALRGMEQLIDRSPHVRVMMEFCPLMLDKYEIGAKQVINFFESRGFYCWNIGDDGSLTKTHWANLLERPDQIRNVVIARNLMSERAWQSSVPWV